MPLTYSALREIQKKEMESSEIVKVEPDFYEQVSTLLRERKLAAMNDDSMSALKEYENIRKIASGIQAKREEKIVLMALRGDKIHEGLTEKEHELLEYIMEKLNDTRMNITSEWNRNNEKSESETSKTTNKKADAQKVIILKDVAQYKGIDSKIYGPFKSKEQAILPTSEAEWLIKAKMAENIEK